MGLKLENVSKKFVGKQAVDNISFEVDKPGVFGLLGTNGAGKTTTIRMLLGIIKKIQVKLPGMVRRLKEKVLILVICQRKEVCIQRRRFMTN